MPKAYLFLCHYCGGRFESVSLPHGIVRCPDCGTTGCKALEDKDYYPEDEPPEAA